ncbi:S-layer homology domain-containing protein [Domibacillus aminovorans]|uniref:S-layer homology domain-containing protein n=1 Tax=Domibacillus aminovorans TaxID=29332 RepID=UPI0012FE253A
MSKSSTAYPYNQKILAAQITTGYRDNTYRPNMEVTCAQFAAFTARKLNLM